MTPVEIVGIMEKVGLVGCLVIGLRWAVSRMAESQREIVDLLTGVIAQNTEALTKVRDTLTGCHHREKE